MKYRNALPQLHGDAFITDGGMETTLVYLEGLELPEFAAFDLLREPEGTACIERYYRQYAELAREHGKGLILETATWRASKDWGDRLGYYDEALAAINRKSVEILEQLRREVETETTPIVISGCLGPRGDGYVPGDVMTPEEAEAYHAIQVEIFSQTAADLVTAMTITNVPEAVGIVRAARRAAMPSVISFTVETDGRLPSGDSLDHAINETDRLTDGGPTYYMINCAHPTHFDAALTGEAPWLARIKGLRANASRRSHAELDSASDLDDGDPKELAEENAALRHRLPHLTVLGGCCGTDHRHIGEICRVLDRVAAE